MTDLGRLEDLPAAYVDALRAQNLVPLWPSLRAAMPANAPKPRTLPTMWSYEALKPLLLEAGRLTPIDKAERRVLVLANPGHGLDRMQASAAIYLGLQLLLPGEWAPAHRHTPNAVRMVVEGTGAWTTVDGEKCPMERGDLILTPSGLWHEHGHEGREPVVWLDVLDLPLMIYAEVSYHVNGSRTPAAAVPASTARRHGGLRPSPAFRRDAKPYPVLRYAWSDAKAALQEIAAAPGAPEAVQVTYVNPETGGDAENVLGFHALMLRPAQTLVLPARSPAQVFHVIEGAATVAVEAQRFALAAADTCCAPGYQRVTLVNPSARQPAFVFVADESPLHRKLGVYEDRG